MTAALHLARFVGGSLDGQYRWLQGDRYPDAYLVMGTGEAWDYVGEGTYRLQARKALWEARTPA